MARPRDPEPSAATLRKRRQMAKRREEGRRLVLLTPAPEVMDVLETLGRVTGRGVKGAAELVLRRAARGAIEELRGLAGKLGPVYREAEVYGPYTDYLKTPEAHVRIGDRELYGSDWLPLAAKLGAFGEYTRQWGWAKGRGEAFLKAAAAGKIET